VKKEEEAPPPQFWGAIHTEGTAFLSASALTPAPQNWGGGASVSSALVWATPLLTDAGIDTPRFDAQLLLTWTLKVSRTDLVREPERVLTGRERIIYEKAVALRTERRPLPYITGEAWFYGRPFKINRAVLIPRPETEDLVTAALERYAGLSAPRLADIGTGSGCLAVTLALERPDSHVWATDLSPDALTLARKNVVRHGLKARVTLALGDLLAPLPPDVRFDVIVSNPPYIPQAEVPTLQPEVRDYEPLLALSGDGDAAGLDGTALHRRLLREAPAYLQPNGWLLLEVGQGQAETVRAEAEALGYRDTAIRPDLSGIGRVVVGRYVPD
jgi:release factor glutamine methyltransferase